MRWGDVGFPNLPQEILSHILSMRSVWSVSFLICFVCAHEIVHPILKEIEKKSFAAWTRGSVRMKSLKLSKTSAYGNLGAIRDRYLHHLCAVHLQTMIYNSHYLDSLDGTVVFIDPKKNFGSPWRKKWSGVQSFTGVATLEVYSIRTAVLSWAHVFRVVYQDGPSTGGTCLHSGHILNGLSWFISQKVQQPLQKHWMPYSRKMTAIADLTTKQEWNVSALLSVGCKDTTDTGIEENCAGNSWMEDERSMSSQKLKLGLVSILALIAQIILKSNQPLSLRHWFSSIWTQLE